MQKQNYIPNELKIIKRILFQKYSLDVVAILFKPQEMYLDFINKKLTNKKVNLTANLFAYSIGVNADNSIDVLNKVFNPIYLSDVNEDFESEGITLSNHNINPARLDKDNNILLPQVTLKHVLKHPTSMTSSDYIVKLQINSVVTVFPGKEEADKAIERISK